MMDALGQERTQADVDRDERYFKLEEQGRRMQVALDVIKQPQADPKLLSAATKVLLQYLG